MATIAPAELQALSDWLSNNVLTDSCAIQREESSVWITVETVNCILDDPTSFEANIADEVTGAVLKRIRMPRNTDVRSPDRLQINGIDYRVFALLDPETYEVLRRILVVRFPQRGGA